MLVSQPQSKGFKNRVLTDAFYINPRLARFNGLERVDEEREKLTKLEDMNNSILHYLSEEVPTSYSDRVCSCAEILQIKTRLEEMRQVLKHEFQSSAERLHSQGKPTLKERLQLALHELNDAISVYHQMAKEVPKNISATPSPAYPDYPEMSSPTEAMPPPENGFLLTPSSLANSPPLVAPVLLSESTEKINFCPRCGTSLSESPPSTVPATIYGSSPAFSKTGNNWKNPGCTIIICPSCTWKASNNTENNDNKDAFIMTATAWNTGNTNYWCI